MTLTNVFSEKGRYAGCQMNYLLLEGLLSGGNDSVKEEGGCSSWAFLSLFLEGIRFNESG